MAPRGKAKNVKQIVRAFDKAARPVVHEVFDLVQKGLGRTNTALRSVESNVDRMADAAIRFVSDQVDALAGNESRTRKRAPKKTRARPAAKRR